MSTVTIEQAQAELPQLIQQLHDGEEVIITLAAKPVAKLTAVTEPPKTRRQLGTLSGSVLYMAPDFDAPLRDAIRPGEV